MADELWKWCRAQRFSEPMTCRFVAAYGEMSSLLACARDEAVVKETLVEVGVPAGQRNQMLKAVRALAATLSNDDEAAVAPAAPVPAEPRRKQRGGKKHQRKPAVEAAAVAAPAPARARHRRPRRRGRGAGAGGVAAESSSAVI